MCAYHLKLCALPDVRNDLLYSAPEHLGSLLFEFLILWAPSLQPCTFEMCCRTCSEGSPMPHPHSSKVQVVSALVKTVIIQTTLKMHQL